MGGHINQVRTSIALVNNTLLSVKMGPTAYGGLHWWVLRVRMTNGDDVARVCSVRILNVSNFMIHELSSGSLNTTVTSEMLLGMGTTIAATGNKDCGNGPIILAPGCQLELEWAAGGASAGGTGYYAVDYQEYLP